MDTTEKKQKMEMEGSKYNDSFICKASKKLTMFAGILLGMVLIMMSGCSKTSATTEQVRQGMTAYLNDRYSMEFEVDTPAIVGDGNGAIHRAKAHPKGQPEIQFLVSDWMSVNKHQIPDPTKRYSDNYLDEKWFYQGEQEIAKKLREVYGPEVDFCMGTYEFTCGGYALKDLDYGEVFEKSHGKGRVFLSYVIFMDSAQFNKATEAEKVYKILKPFVVDYGTEDYVVSVKYIDKADKRDYLSNPDPYNDKARKQDYSGNKDKKIIENFWIRSSAAKPLALNSSSDIIKFSEY